MSIKFYYNSHAHVFACCLWLLELKQNWVVVTEIFWPTKPKILIYWPIKEKLCCSCFIIWAFIENTLFIMLSPYYIYIYSNYCHSFLVVHILIFLLWLLWFMSNTEIDISFSNVCINAIVWIKCLLSSVFLVHLVFLCHWKCYLNGYSESFTGKVFIGIALNLYIALVRMDILIMLILLIHEHEIPSHFCFSFFLFLFL